MSPMHPSMWRKWLMTHDGGSGRGGGDVRGESFQGRAGEDEYRVSPFDYCKHRCRQGRAPGGPSIPFLLTRLNNKMHHPANNIMYSSSFTAHTAHAARLHHHVRCFFSTHHRFFNSQLSSGVTQAPRQCVPVSV